MAHTEQLNASEVLEAQTRPEFAVELLEHGWQRRLCNPLTDEDATERLRRFRSVWADNATTVLTSGAYDLLHLNHTAYLLETKLQGAACHYGRFYEGSYGATWNELPAEAQESLTVDFLRDQELKLIVSVDGNEKVAGRKSKRSEKGGDTRPVLDWETRARIVASLSLELPNQAHHPIADCITMNDPVALAGGPHEDLFEQVAFLQPDVWAAYHESEYIFEEAPHDHRLRHVELRRINASDPYTDALIGNFSTTAILNRLKG